MKSKLAVLVACLLCVAVAQSPEIGGDRSRLPCGAIGGETGGGLVGGAILGIGGTYIGGAIGWLVARPNNIDEMNWTVLTLMGAGGFAGITFGTAIGTCLAGRMSRQEGKWRPTLLGALAGTAVGIPVAVAGAQGAPPLLLVGALMPTAGAVVGYNLSRPGPETAGRYNRLLNYPSISVTPSARGPAALSVNARLLNLRF